MNIDFVLCSQLLVNSLDIHGLVIIVFGGEKKLFSGKKYIAI